MQETIMHLACEDLAKLGQHHMKMGEFIRGVLAQIDNVLLCPKQDTRRHASWPDKRLPVLVGVVHV